MSAGATRSRRPRPSNGRQGVEDGPWCADPRGSEPGGQAARHVDDDVPAVDRRGEVEVGDEFEPPAHDLVVHGEDVGEWPARVGAPGGRGYLGERIEQRHGGAGRVGAHSEPGSRVSEQSDRQHDPPQLSGGGRGEQPEGVQARVERGAAGAARAIPAYRREGLREGGGHDVAEQVAEAGEAGRGVERDGLVGRRTRHPAAQADMGATGTERRGEGEPASRGVNGAERCGAGHAGGRGGDRHIDRRYAVGADRGGPGEGRGGEVDGHVGVAGGDGEVGARRRPGSRGRLPGQGADGGRDVRRCRCYRAAESRRRVEKQSVEAAGVEPARADQPERLEQCDDSGCGRAESGDHLTEQDLDLGERGGQPAGPVGPDHPPLAGRRERRGVVEDELGVARGAVDRDGDLDLHPPGLQVVLSSARAADEPPVGHAEPQGGDDRPGRLEGRHRGVPGEPEQVERATEADEDPAEVGIEYRHIDPEMQLLHRLGRCRLGRDH